MTPSPAGGRTGAQPVRVRIRPGALPSMVRRARAVEDASPYGGDGVRSGEDEGRTEIPISENMMQPIGADAVYIDRNDRIRRWARLLLREIPGRCGGPGDARAAEPAGCFRCEDAGSFAG